MELNDENGWNFQRITLNQLEGYGVEYNSCNLTSSSRISSFLSVIFTENMQDVTVTFIKKIAEEKWDINGSSILEKGYGKTI